MEIKEIFKKDNPTPVIYANHSLGNGLSRSEIEDAILGAGFLLPVTEVSFFIVGTVRAWIVHYFPPLDKYGVEKLSMK